MKKKIFLTLTIFIISIALFACGAQPDQTPLEPATATEIVSPPTQPPAIDETSTTAPTTEAALPTETPAASVEVSFANDVMPIFENNCIKCHGGERTREGLDLKTYDGLMTGSSNGTVLEAGNADDSLFIQQIIEGEMPKRGDKLSDSDIQILINWVNAGALNN